MATIKSYTDLDQSRKLAEILPLESADMCYMYLGAKDKEYQDFPICAPAMEGELPCWSLAALLDVLPRIEDFKPVLDLEINCIQYPSDIDLCAIADNPVDACVAMIERLNELNLL